MESTRDPAGGGVVVRGLSENDLPTLLALIDALADYEHLPRPDEAARSRLRRDALADPPRFHVMLAERAGQVTGYAIYLLTYSSFLALPSLFIEDLFVLPGERRSRVGTALMRALAREAVRLSCGRMEWTVLTWNTDAQQFYQRLGARHLEAWQVYRMTEDEIARTNTFARVP